MFKLFMCFILIVSFNFFPQICNAENSETSIDKNEQIQIKIRYNKYKKNKKDLKKQTFIKEQKQKELEYLEKRLDAKKKKLESLTSDNGKGEKQ